ncbi:hypothetical protein J6590_027832 [Homalodisca vitripennis]|nr:hypothetical protein J6590_027832 [Homalodisca vitripennis]
MTLTYTCLHVCTESGSGSCPHVANRHVGDLFLDLQDGLNLISLLEVLSGEHLSAIRRSQWRRTSNPSGVPVLLRAGRQNKGLWLNVDMLTCGIIAVRDSVYGNS